MDLAGGGRRARCGTIAEQEEGKVWHHCRAGGGGRTCHLLLFPGQEQPQSAPPPLNSPDLLLCHPGLDVIVYTRSLLGRPWVGRVKEILENLTFSIQCAEIRKFIPNPMSPYWLTKVMNEYTICDAKDVVLW